MKILLQEQQFSPNLAYAAPRHCLLQSTFRTVSNPDTKDCFYLEYSWDTAISSARRTTAQSTAQKNSRCPHGKQDVVDRLDQISAEIGLVREDMPEEAVVTADGVDDLHVWIFPVRKPYNGYAGFTLYPVGIHQDRIIAPPFINRG